MIGPLFVGLLAQFFSVRAGFVCCCAVPVVALILVPRFRRES